MCVGAIVAFYLYLVFVNRHDRPPSATALRFAQLPLGLPPVADEDNGYIYFVGMDADRALDPIVLGKQRILWANERLTHADVEAVTSFPDDAGKPPRKASAASARFFEQCKQVDHACARLLEENQAAIESLLKDEAWKVERFERLMAYRQWRERMEFDIRNPMQKYATMFEAHKLFMLKAWLLAGQGDAVSVNKALELEGRFLRRMLAESDVLISQAFAGALLRQHFAWGSLVLRHLALAKQTSAIPDVWRDPISDAERSMRRAFVGEWRYANTMFRDIGKDKPHNTQHGEDIDELMGYLPFKGKSLFQFQDTSNREAEWLDDMANRSAVPYDQLKAANAYLVAQSAQLEDTMLWPGAYNILGNILLRVSVAGFPKYAFRIADLEGIRRASLVTAQLRGKGIAIDDMAAQLRASALCDPYDGKALEWHSARKAVVFVGLTAGAQGRTEVNY